MTAPGVQHCFRAGRSVALPPCFSTLNGRIRMATNAKAPSAVNSLVNDEPSALRLATEADLGELLRWRNDPETRHFRDDPRLIEPDEHAVWLERRQRSESRVYVCEYAGRPVGNITLDVSARGCELGWIIAPEWRGRGIGKAMVGAAIKMMPCDRPLWCKMRDDNIASSRLALSCGFRLSGKDGAMLILELPPESRKASADKQ